MVKKIRKCKTCGTELEIDVSINNWKNLFRKPTLDEYIMLFIVLMSVFSYFQYTQDINNLKEYYEGGDYCTYISQINFHEPNNYPLNTAGLYIENSSLVNSDEAG